MITYDAPINTRNESDVRLNINFTPSKSKDPVKAENPVMLNRAHTHTTQGMYTHSVLVLASDES